MLSTRLYGDGDLLAQAKVLSGGYGAWCRSWKAVKSIRSAPSGRVEESSEYSQQRRIDLGSIEICQLASPDDAVAQDGAPYIVFVDAQRVALDATCPLCQTNGCFHPQRRPTVLLIFSKP